MLFDDTSSAASSAKDETSLPSTERGREMLSRLAALLEQNAKNKKGMRFDLGVWASAHGDCELGLDCRTTGCAMGLAALSGEFPDLVIEEEDCFFDNSHRGTMATIRYRGELEGIRAAAALFEISEVEAGWLFLEDDYLLNDLPTKGAKGERVVADRIRKFIAGTEAPRDVLEVHYLRG